VIQTPRLRKAPMSQCFLMNFQIHDPICRSPAPQGDLHTRDGVVALRGRAPTQNTQIF
jgi:hypothetical protein